MALALALSWLAREIGLSYDLIKGLMIARERRTEWLAHSMEQCDPSTDDRLLQVIIGKSFKPETSITTGSPAILLRNILQVRGHDVAMWGSSVEVGVPCPQFPPSVFLIGTKHPSFAESESPKGSVVNDPWRYLPPRPASRSSASVEVPVS